MAKKAKQWLIDRAFNFDNSNEKKIRSVLSNIAKFQSGEITYDDAVQNMVVEGAISSVERYERSTQTLFKSYGLLLSKTEVTGISKEFLANKINFKELALFQCFKKQYVNNDSFKIRPLIVTLAILYKAYANEETRKYAWVDLYDYMNILTEIDSYDGVDEYFEKFIKDKEMSQEERLIEDVKDCDIWYNFFVTTGLFVKKSTDLKYCICLNIGEISLIKYILANHQSAMLIDETEDWLTEFGKSNNGLVEILPKIQFGKNDELPNVDIEIKKQVLYYTLIDGIPAKICDDLILKSIGQNSLTAGCLTKAILQSFGIAVSIQSSVLGIYKPFRNYPGILRLSQDYMQNKRAFDVLLASICDMNKRNFFGIHITSQNSALNADNPHICIGWSAMGDLSQVADENSLIQLHDKAYGNSNYRAVKQNISQIWSFLREMKIDDFVVFYDGEKANIGQITSDYYYETETEGQDPDYVNNRRVVWLKSVQYADLPAPLKKASYAARSIFSLNNYKADILALLNNQYIIEDKIEEENKKMIKRKPRTFTENPMNIILYGAPGTGKTYSTVEYALAIANKKPITSVVLGENNRETSMAEYNQLVDSGRIVFTTFHQSYGYEDFIQGLRPNIHSETLSFKVANGVFKKIADRAMQDENNDYVIVIDEINRANISKVFGELITLIEDDKRWGEENAVSVILPSGEEFAVPNNLYILGTMNSADKSISLIDTALRRRFSFIEKAPMADMVTDEKLRTVLESLNNYIKSELKSTDLLIGHAFFIGKCEDDLERLMNNNIIPLLYEYFYDDENKVKKALECLKDTKFEVDKNHIGRIRIKVKE